MKQPRPIQVIDLFPELHDGLVGLLSGLTAEQWAAPTACVRWSAKDVALHLLGGDVGVLSRVRDGHLPAGKPIENWDDLVALVNDLNDTWVKATRRISPRVLCDLLRFTGGRVQEYFSSLDLNATGGSVDWAGPEPAPIWLDVAREYTERWHHQQHIRDAVGKPGFTEPRYFAPALDAFVRALPHTYRQIEAADGTHVALKITGDSGGRWLILREGRRWALYVSDDDDEARAEVVMPQDFAWRLFTKGVRRDEARTKVKILGDESLGLKMLDTVSIIG